MQIGGLLLTRAANEEIRDIIWSGTVSYIKFYEDSKNDYYNLISEVEMADFLTYWQKISSDVCERGPVVERSLRVRKVPGSILSGVKIVNHCLEGYRSWN